MNIAVIGAGTVGRTLARAWTRHGHHVTVGVRRPAAADIPAMAVSDALHGADAVLLAIPGAALTDLLDRHADALDGRLVLDATNRVGASTLHQVPEVAARLPAARLARAFCTVGWEVLADPVIGGEQADLVWCGPDGADGELVQILITDVGLRSVRVGGIEAADVVDGATRLWFALALGQGLGRHLGIRILRDA
jgi:predicted dinucleotide-binding enzyme